MSSKRWQVRKAQWMAQKEKAKNTIARNPSIAGAMSALMRAKKTISYGANRIFTFKQHSFQTTIVNATGDYGIGYVFKLSSLDQAATFTALFDQYRIDKVKLQFVPRSSITHDVYNPAAAVVPPAYMYIATDYDDANTPTMPELREKDNSKIVSLVSGKPIYHTLKPRAATPVYNGVVLNGYAMTGKNTWYDCASAGIEFYGVKVVIPGGGPSTPQNIIVDVNVTYYLSFKGVR